jgi:DNA modification methylase
MNKIKFNFRSLNLTVDLPTSAVNIEDKTRSNLFTWRGQFSPQLIEQILLNYASHDSIVFDPFLGSGTVLFESALLGLEASGCEINPAAISFAKVYELINQSEENVTSAISTIETVVSKYANDLPLFGCSDIDGFEKDILEVYKETEIKVEKTILFALITGMDFDTKKIDTKRLNNVWNILKSNIENLPKSNKQLKVYHSDSRSAPIKDESIDFVITSPPYINVFNYHQNYRKSVEKTGVDVLSVAKSEIGANRKFRQNRFLTVVQYCMDMSMVFEELQRVCKKDAKTIFIVGRESKVRRTSFKNAELVISVAKVNGFDLIGQQTRKFGNKFGELIYEEILRFSKVSPKFKSAVEESRNIGILALMLSRKNCAEEVKDEIQEAIIKAKNIDSSPILNIKG